MAGLGRGPVRRCIAIDWRGVYDAAGRKNYMGLEWSTIGVGRGSAGPVRGKAGSSRCTLGIEGLVRGMVGLEKKHVRPE